MSLIPHLIRYVYAIKLQLFDSCMCVEDGGRVQVFWFGSCPNHVEGSGIHYEMHIMVAYMTVEIPHDQNKSNMVTTTIHL